MELARRFALALQHLPLRVEQGVEGVLEIERFVDAVPTERAQAAQDKIAPQPHAESKREATPPRDEPGVERDSTAPVSPVAQPEIVAGEERAPMGARIDVPTREADPHVVQALAEADSANDLTSGIVEAHRALQAPSAAPQEEATAEDVHAAAPAQAVQRQAQPSAEQAVSPGKGKPSQATDEVEEHAPEKAGHRTSSHELQTVEPHARLASPKHEVPERKPEEVPSRPTEPPASKEGSSFALDELELAPAQVPAPSVPASGAESPPSAEVPRLQKLSQWLQQPSAAEPSATEHVARTRTAESVVAASVAAWPDEASKSEGPRDVARTLAASESRRSTSKLATPVPQKPVPQVNEHSSEPKVRIGSLALRFTQPAPTRDSRRSATEAAASPATGKRPFDLPPHSFVS